jgi:hypothetical protein
MVGETLKVPRVDEDIEIQLAQHSSELRSLAETQRATRESLERLSDDIHQLTHTVTIISSRPAFSAGDLLDNIIKVGTIAGLAVAGILYVNQAFVAQDLEQIRSHVGKIEDRQTGILRREERLENVLIYKGAGMTPPQVPQ